MNYYERHLGDYAKDTVHLSQMEHGAYTLLIDRYYTSENGIPEGLAHRIGKATTRAEKAAVDFVLREFFTLVDGVWIKARIEEELQRAQKKIHAAQENGKKGGRQKFSGKVQQNQGEAEPAGFDIGSKNKTQTKAHQTPDTRHQTPNISVVEIGSTHTEIYSEQGARACVDQTTQTSSTTAGECCKAMMQAGVSGCNPSHPTLAALILAGASVQEFSNAARLSVAKGKCNFAYVVGTIKRQREDAAKLVLHQGRMPNKQEALENSNRAVAGQWMPPELQENHKQGEAA